jgi:TDG/mug DNA glycosylase family protein
MPHLFHPSEQYDLLKLGLGITNVVARASAAADELTREELIEGGRILEEKVLQYEPLYLAIVGIGAYRTAFDRPKAKMGLQEERIGRTRIWVLPNPSGLNANYRPAELVELFAQLCKAAQPVFRSMSREVKWAMFWAQVVAQNAGEPTVSRERIVASLLRVTGGKPTDDFERRVQLITGDLTARGLELGSKEQMAEVEAHMLRWDETIEPLLKSVIHDEARANEIVTPREILQALAPDLATADRA